MSLLLLVGGHRTRGEPGVGWLEVERQFLVIERVDRCSPSGVREVSFTLATSDIPDIEVPEFQVITKDDPLGQVLSSLGLPAGGGGPGGAGLPWDGGALQPDCCETPPVTVTTVEPPEEGEEPCTPEVQFHSPGIGQVGSSNRFRITTPIQPGKLLLGTIARNQPVPSALSNTVGLSFSLLDSWSQGELTASLWIADVATEIPAPWEITCTGVASSSVTIVPGACTSITPPTTYDLTTVSGDSGAVVVDGYALCFHIHYYENAYPAGLNNVSSSNPDYYTRTCAGVAWFPEGGTLEQSMSSHTFGQGCPEGSGEQEVIWNIPSDFGELLVFDFAVPP